MDIVGIIPARYASVRLPGKPLVDLGGKSMIVRTYQQAVKVKQFAIVVVATDDERIYREVLSANGNVVMTSSAHCSGTDRCAEAMQQLRYDPQQTIVVNIQGDEPFIQPEQIEELIHCINREKSQIATLIKKTVSVESLQNPNVVKVVISNDNQAMYFSRSAIPFLRNTSFEETSFYEHIGIYAYRGDVLNELVKLSVSSLEKAESLEQLRWLQHGYEIQTCITNYQTSIGIDTSEDVKKALLYIQNQNN